MKPLLVLVVFYGEAETGGGGEERERRERGEVGSSEACWTPENRTRYT
jgi:hypothetical protein